MFTHYGYNLKLPHYYLPQELNAHFNCLGSYNLVGCFSSSYWKAFS